MRLPLVGGTYTMDARSFDLQRTVNMYPIKSEVGNSKSSYALRSTPGLSLFSSPSTAPTRGAFTSAKYGRVFFVAGNEFFEILSDGTFTKHGELETFSKPVHMESNGEQLCIVDGLKGYLFQFDTNTFSTIIASGFPDSPIHVAFLDGYFIVARGGTGQFYISGINDGNAWDPLDFTTVESNPDDIVAVIADRGVLRVFSELSTEIFQNSVFVAGAFPFERISGTARQIGCAATATVKRVGEGIVWVGKDDQGRIKVWQSQGYDAVAVSTQSIERKLKSSQNFANSYAWIYHEQGHTFYCLQVSGLTVTLVYDLDLQVWHERTYGLNDKHLGACCTFGFNKNLVGDRLSGKVYEMSLSYYSDNGQEIIRERVFPPLSNENFQQRFSRFELDMEVGVGAVTGQGQTPLLALRYSDDGGGTWSSWIYRSVGGIGEYGTRVVWAKLGSSRRRVFALRYSEPTFLQINEAYVNAA